MSGDRTPSTWRVPGRATAGSSPPPSSPTAGVRPWRPPPAGTEPLDLVFSDSQRAFLADCADIDVGFGSLDVFGPVHTVRRHGVRLDHHEVTLEHWTLPGGGGDDEGVPLEWLEVSERVAPEGAEVVQASLTALLKGKGLEPDLGSGIRVRRVLEELVAQGARRSPWRQ